MSTISLGCFGICTLIVLSAFRSGADALSPGRVFGFVWSLAVGLADLKFSSLQRVWATESWMLLLTGVSAFLVGTYITYVLNIEKKLVPISSMRLLIHGERVREERLFRLVSASVAVYAVSYLVIYLAKGFLPIFAVGQYSRVDFYVFGFGVLINITSCIVFFTLLYLLLVQGNRTRKAILAFLAIFSLGTYFLLLQRFQVIMAVVICFTLLYYATHLIRPRTMLLFTVIVVAFFYWILSLRLGHLAMTFTYVVSQMRFPVEFAALTEPYMYMVMNLENFAHAVTQVESHTWGYFTFDFLTALSGLKYWIIEYSGLNRMPFLTSGYNTYTALFWFYSDFGVPGLALFPFLLGFGTGTLYYKMRSRPTIKNVTAYGVLVFVMVISFFNFPISFLWFELNVLILYLFLRWCMLPRAGLTIEGRQVVL
jgi:oligosaccharide repeat unit polymerase